MSFNYIFENGVIVPDTSAIKTEVTEEWKAIAGADATVDPSSFEGRLLDADTNERISVARNNAELANQLNPEMATGTFIDSHLALIGSKRDGEEQSTVECKLTGIIGTPVNAGSFVEDDNSNIWVLVDDAIIGSDNSIIASFRSVIFGPVNAGIGVINKIVSGVVGWETIINEAEAAPGKLAQSGVSAKRQRRKEFGANTRSVSYSVISAVHALEGVNGVQFRENRTKNDMTIDDIFLLSNSSWLCVDGGVTSEIVPAYYDNRWGTDFNGAVEYEHTDHVSGQVVNVKLDRADDKRLICRVTARIGRSGSGADDIKEAVISYANGEVEDERGFYLGVDSSPFEVAAGVNFQMSGVFITKCELAVFGGTLNTNTIINAINEKPSITESDIEVILT